MDLRLTGKRALVTGGSRGIGKAVARQLAAEGADVAVVARTAAALEASARELSQESGRRVVAVPADTGSDQQVRDMVATVAAELGGIDILVNAAATPGGGAPRATLGDITSEMVLAEVNIKVLGYLRCAREVAPHMRASGWGRIISISGLGARKSGNTVGSMRNVAVAAMTKNLADELGRDGINVTVVHPGMTWTERMPGLIERRARDSGREPAEVAQELGSGNAVGRMITAEEVADVVTFLASPRSVAINGDAVAVGGGDGRAIHY